MLPSESTAKNIDPELFLKLDEIFSGLIGYSALGMTVITIIPFIAIIFFSVRLLEGRVNAAKIITQILVWIFYG